MLLVFNATDIFAVLFLIFLEGVLSFDNALVLALMVKHLPEKERRRALTYGIWGAFFFRFVSLFFLTYLMNIHWIKWAGGAYLLYVAIHGLLSEGKDEEVPSSPFSFWKTVLMVEIMDIAFSIDSILAAVSLSQNYFVVLIGGLLGIVMMRFAASIFIRLIALFPKLSYTAYLLVFIIGWKLIIQGFDLPYVDFHSSKSPASWAFWMLMLATVLSGFRGKQKQIGVVNGTVEK